MKQNAPILALNQLPPQELQVESSVLGALLLENECYEKVVDLLKPEVFYLDKNRILYEAIVGICENYQVADLLKVKRVLEESGNLEKAGGVSYLVKITSEVTSTIHVRTHALILVKKYVQREIIRVLTHSLKTSFDENNDAFDLLENTEREISAIAMDNFQSTFAEMPELIEGAKELIKNGRKGAVKSGLKKLDEITHGWMPGELLILAARPAMGKTALALNITMNMVIDQKLPVAFFSLEMSSLQLATRLLTSISGLNGEKIKRGKLSKSEWVQLNTKVLELEQAPLYIDDTPGLNVMELRAKGQKLARQQGVKMIIIDYLQLMQGGLKNLKNRQEEISYISRELKKLSKELELPIIALSQLSRMTETRAAGPDGLKGKPQLSDLRESGAIEQDADMVMFIYRPEYYGITADENNNSLIGITELDIAKHRSGKTGEIPLRFVKEIGKFEDVEGFSLDHDEKSLNIDGVSYKNYPSKMNNVAESSTYKSEMEER